MQRDLPNTLPGWTIAFLAVQGDWVARDRLLALLWPDATAAEAHHSLRVNLHRARSVLAAWGVAEALETERKRVRLRLPTDVAELRRSLNSADAQTPPATAWRPLLSSMSLPGFPALQEWLELERAELQALWRERLLPQLDAEGLAPAAAVAICQALLAADPLDEEALAQLLRRLQQLGRAGEAARLYETFRARLSQDIGAEPSPLLQALVSGMVGAAAVTGPGAPPARDAFVGRDIELGQIKAMLTAAEGRIVTLLGPGGVGKSRVARELMRHVGDQWADGAGWVALGDLGSASDALPRLAECIGLSLAPNRDARSQVVRALADRHVLLILDNAEHLAELPPLLDALRAGAPGVSWLVTSRSPLGVPGERSFTLEGLSHPQGDDCACDVEQALTFDAVRLLDQRARALNPAFDIAAQWPAHRELIQRVGGWPLALEMVASALALHGADAVLSDLLLSIDTLAAGRPPEQARHDSVRASLELSWRLLGVGEQAALARLSVFRGGFTRAAALAVTRSAAPLARLVERSLVQVSGNGRFDLHPLVGQFAAERLADDPAAQVDAAQRHGEHFASRLRACAEPDVAGAGATLKEIEADFENLRAAWGRLTVRRDSVELGLCAGAWAEFGAAKGRAAELAQLVSAAMPATEHDMAARAALLAAAASLRFRAGEIDTALALAREGLHVATAAGDEPGRRALLVTLALALKDLGRYGEAEQVAQEGLRRSREAGVEREIAAHANTCAMLAKTRGDQAGAARLYEEAVAIHRRNGNHRSLAMCLNNLGNTLRATGDMPAAQQSFEEALRTADQQGIASTRAFALVNLAIVHQQCGRSALVQSYARRARAEPAAEPAVLLAVDAVMLLMAIERRDFDAARGELGALARRARQTGLHAALLETVGSHAKLLAALGQRGAALARLVYLERHPQLPALQRSDVQQALHALAPTPPELARAAALADGCELDALVEQAAVAGPPEDH